jgi:acetoacetate decarboxylase
MNSALRGYAAPLDPTGRASLYGPPPWRFHGRILSVFLACDADWLARMVPAPLRPYSPAIARLSIYELTCDYGFGAAFTAERPELANFCEGGLSLYVEHNGKPGLWSAFIWCDNDAEIAVGREIYGWPQLLGSFAITRKPYRRDWRAADRLTALASRYGRTLFELGMSVERAGDLDIAIPPFTDFYTMSVLPGVARADGIARTIVRTRMDDVSIEGIWSGAGSVKIHCAELEALASARVLGARTHDLAWSKPHGHVVHRDAVALEAQWPGAR